VKGSAVVEDGCVLRRGFSIGGAMALAMEDVYVVTGP
jgi:hypothetical protein